MDPSLSKRNMLLLAVIAAILVIYFIPIGSHPLLEPDEGRYAEIPREMIESGNYITPMLNYVKYFEKPVLLYWMNAGSFKLFGETDFAARFASASCAVLGTAAVGLLGAFMFGNSVGILSALVTATSLLYFVIGTINVTDMPLSFFMTLALAAFYVGQIKKDRRWFLLFYAAMALGLLTKGLVAIVLPGGIIFWYIVLSRKWRLVPDVLYIPGIILFLAISVPWFYLVCRDNPDFFHFFFIQEHFLRYTTKIHHRYEPFWYFLPIIPAALVPWTGFFLALFSRKSIVRTPDNSAAKDATLFLLLWSGVILLFYSLSDSKLIPYIVPCLPPLAILIAADIDRMVRQRQWHGWALIWSAGIALVFSAGLFFYAATGDVIAHSRALTIAIKLSAGLLTGPFCAFWITRGRRKDFRTAAVILCVSACFFIAGMQDIYKIMGQTRSSYQVSSVIINNAAEDDTIAVYGEVLQGIPFYTKRRVMLIDYSGELRFGANQREGKGWFPSAEEFRVEWQARKKPYVLIIRKDRLGELFPGGNAGETKKIEVDRYLILFNREGTK
ncbi:MAG: glycosyltransferase family 39 protein [Synergistaceae bacterium]|nr:glycosyltransferase family 39 protein [Synergistaceae bacterium]